MIQWLTDFYQKRFERRTKLSDLERISRVLFKTGKINHLQLHMIEGILQYHSLKVRDIMLPRCKIIGIEEHTSRSELITLIQQHKHSRYPVYSQTLDTIKGVFLAKDIIGYQGEDKDIVKQTLRPILRIPESKTLDSLLKDFRTSHNHMAIVLDEFAKPSGLITIEDVIEQITGNIEDEYDYGEDDSHKIREISSGVFIVDTSLAIDDFNKQFNTKLSDEYFHTIGGIIAQEFGKIPKKGAKCTLSDLEITVVHASSKHIKIVEVKRKKV